MGRIIPARGSDLASRALFDSPQSDLQTRHGKSQRFGIRIRPALGDDIATVDLRDRQSQDRILILAWIMQVQVDGYAQRHARGIDQFDLVVAAMQFKRRCAVPAIAFAPSAPAAESTYPRKCVNLVFSQGVAG